jgi:hypothetical protein
MDLEIWFFILIIAGPVLSVLGWLFWVGVVALIAKNAFGGMANSNTRGFGSGTGYGHMDALFVQLDQALRAASAGRGAKSASAGLQNLSPEQQLQIQKMFMQAQNQMSQMDALSRQRYDTRMGDLTGMAASAGIDWKPGSY